MITARVGFELFVFHGEPLCKCLCGMVVCDTVHVTVADEDSGNTTLACIVANLDLSSRKICSPVEH